jgi:hypothetical protein
MKTVTAKTLAGWKVKLGSPLPEVGETVLCVDNFHLDADGKHPEPKEQKVIAIEQFGPMSTIWCDGDQR